VCPWRGVLVAPIGRYRPILLASLVTWGISMAMRGVIERLL
jgi:hypothetical protein